MCVCINDYVHTDKGTKTIPRWWNGPYTNSNGSPKAKHHHQCCWNQKKLLNSDLKLTQRHCWAPLMRECSPPEEIKILACSGPSLSLSEASGLILPPHLLGVGQILCHHPLWQHYGVPKISVYFAFPIWTFCQRPWWSFTLPSLGAAIRVSYCGISVLYRQDLLLLTTVILEPWGSVSSEAVT